MYALMKSNEWVILFYFNAFYIFCYIITNASMRKLYDTKQSTLNEWVICFF